MSDFLTERDPITTWADITPSTWIKPAYLTDAEDASEQAGREHDQAIETYLESGRQKHVYDMLDAGTRAIEAETVRVQALVRWHNECKNCHKLPAEVGSSLCRDCAAWNVELDPRDADAQDEQDMNSSLRYGG